MNNKSYFIKELNSEKEGEFTAYATTNDADRCDEVVSKKAFDEVARTIEHVPMFFGHAGSDNVQNVIGNIHILDSDENGLKVKGVLSKKNQNYELIYDLLKMKALDKLSIGFIAAKNWIKENELGQKVYEKIDLLETSIVPIPANPNAQILDVKKFENKEENMDESQKTEISSKIDDLSMKIEEINTKIDAIKTNVQALIDKNAEVEEIEAEDEEIKTLKSLMKGKNE